MNDYEQRCNEQSIKVQGHDVTIFSPANVRITLHCPWNAPKLGYVATQRQQLWFMDQSQRIVNYLISEGFINNPGKGTEIVNIQVFAEFES